MMLMLAVNNNFDDFLTLAVHNSRTIKLRVRPILLQRSKKHRVMAQVGAIFWVQRCLFEIPEHIAWAFVFAGWVLGIWARWGLLQLA